MNFERLKICIIAGTLGQGGAERQLYYIVKGLISKGAEVHLLSLTKGEYWENLISEAGAKIYYVGASESRVKRLIYITQRVISIKPNMIQSMHFYTNFYVAAASRATGIPGIGAIRSNLYRELKNNGVILGHLCFRMPKYLISNSLEAIKAAAKFGKIKNIFYLPNAVDTKRFSPAEGKPVTSPLILSVGRFDPNKKFDDFLWIIMELKKKFPNIRAYLIGDGKERGNLLKIADSYGLMDGTVTFTGNVFDTEKFYRASEVCIMTSIFEGTPNVILEAMACGLAVVSTKVGNLPNIIRSGVDGYLVDVGDKQAIVNMAALLLGNPILAKEMGLKARENINANFSCESMINHLTLIYEHVLNISN